VRQHFARFIDDRRISVERRVRFGSSFSSGVMFRRHVGNREPLRLAVYAKERLVSGVGEREKTIRPFLNGGSGEIFRGEQE